MMEDRLPELPKGWVRTHVGEIYDIVGGGTPSTKVDKYWEGDIPWITSADIIDLKEIRPRNHINEEAIQNSATNLVPEKSLIVVTRVGLGKIALTKTPLCFSQDSQALIGNTSLIYPDYSLYYLSQAVQIFKYRHRGTTIAGVTKKQLSELPFALSPISEQHRIVAKIEELFTKLDAGIEALKKIKSQLKRYRQAVLKYAFEGKLTQEWRETNKGKIEPASVLLEKIKEERKKDPKGKFKEFSPVDTSDLPELPEGWVWTRVGDIYNIIGGGTPSTEIDEYWEGNIPWITSADILGLRDIKPRRQINEKAIRNSATNLVPEGSLIVVTRVGLGKIGLTKTSLCFSQDSQALIGNKNFLFPGYSLYYLSKAIQIFKYEHRGTTIAGVTKKQLSELPFALPPIGEQQKIVEEIDNRLSMADEVEKVAEQSLKQSERLRQSILKKAFEGKLVPQDPTDLPAAELLKQIKKEREAPVCPACSRQATGRSETSGKKKKNRPVCNRQKRI